MQKTFNTLPLIFTIAVALGVLFHDTHVDRASTAALALPALLATAGAVDVMTKSGDHTHIERASMPRHANPIRSALPKIQPRDDDRRYIQNKKIYLNGGDQNYIWPSV